MEEKLQSKRRQYASLAILRGLATVFILYDHLIGYRHPEWSGNRIMKFFLTDPLKIIQSFGAFGVCLFFLISGFLFQNGVSSRKNGYSGKEILIKILKIYLSVIMSFMLFAVFNAIVNLEFNTWWTQFTVKEWILSASLFGYFTGLGDVINGTTWFLIPLFFFYIMGNLISKLPAKSNRDKLLAGEFIFSAIGIIVYVLQRFSGITVHGIDILVLVFIPYSGIILYDMVEKKISFRCGCILLGINYLLQVIGIYIFKPGSYADEPYLISYIYSMFLVCLLLWNEKECKVGKLTSFFSKYGLAIYLVHMTWGSFTETSMESLGVPTTISICIAIMVALLIAVFHTEIIEKKIINGILRLK